MISFRESSESFCSGQFELSMNTSFFLSDRSLEPEFACKSAVLDALLIRMGDPD